MEPITAMFEDEGNDNAVIVGRVYTCDKYAIQGNTLHVKRTEYMEYLEN